VDESSSSVLSLGSIDHKVEDNLDLKVDYNYHSMDHMVDEQLDDIMTLNKIWSQWRLIFRLNSTLT
jgi:hypothetical protein